MPVTNTFSAGATVTADDLNTNFSDVLNELSGLTVADMHTNSGLLSTNLADRFGTASETILLAPRNLWDGSAWTVANVDLPNESPSSTISATGGEVWRRYFTIRSGKMAYLVDVSIHAIAVAVGAATAYPAVRVMLNGNTLGGGVAQIQASATRYRLANASPFDNPISSISDGDYISISLGTDPVTSLNTTWSGATITFTYKIELGA